MDTMDMQTLDQREHEFRMLVNEEQELLARLSDVRCELERMVEDDTPVRRVKALESALISCASELRDTPSARRAFAMVEP